MGFFSDLGKIAKDSALGGITAGIRQNQLMNKIMNKFSLNSNLAEGDGYISEDIAPVENDPDFSLYDNVGHVYNVKSTNYNELIKKHPYKFTGVTEADDNESADNIYSNDIEDQYSDEYVLNLPQWGYGDFINERNIFIKHLSNGYDEPGWFYFKVFFDFDSNHGLFGGILRNTYGDKPFSSINSAYTYLRQCSEMFAYEKLVQRIQCLVKFTRLLSYININAPWFFKSVKNLSQASNASIDKFEEEKYIELEFDQEAVDMRLTTLMSLYKYACYDDINNKEIIPENLRKFDMCVAIFEAPIKYVHDIAGNSFKKISNTSNFMSFKIYKFLNCEINMESFGSYIPSDIKNEMPFQLGQNTIKINYDRVYEYNMNEYMGLMLGADGIYLDNPNIDVQVLSDLTTYSEDLIHNSLAKLFNKKSNFILGNVFNQNKRVYNAKLSDYSKTKNFTEYAKTKYGFMTKKFNIIDVGYDVLYKLLGTGYNATAEALKVGNQVIGDGTVLNGHGNYRVGSAVWRAKMKRLVTGNTNLSDREFRLTTVGNAYETNWAEKLRQAAIQNTPTVI